MSEKNDNLMRELQRLDPVRPGELDGAEKGAEASELMARILASDPAAEATPSAADDVLAPRRGARDGRRRLTPPRIALAGGFAAAVAAVVLVVALSGGSSDTGGSHQAPVASILDQAATAATSQAHGTVRQPYTYLKTREVAINTTDHDARSWRVYQSTTREEWVTRNGSGRLRVVAGPSRFVDAADRAEWEGAGRPTFLALGFGRRTEQRWLAAGMLRGRVQTLPTEPKVLAGRLRAEALSEASEIPAAAATLQLIAEDLRNPVATPALRRALYEATNLLPGIENLGRVSDPEGRAGAAVGLTVDRPTGPTRYTLIFDPKTSDILAFEATALEPSGAGAPDGPAILRATVYVESREMENLSDAEGTWLSDFDETTAPGAPTNSFVVYRIPGEIGAG
jgi:hypothetical protein